MKKKIFLDILEIYVPIIMLVVLLSAFLIGIFFRYVLKSPLSWTYELSSIAFLSFVMLSACYAQRIDAHICFDMVYEKCSLKTKCVMRIISGILISLTCIALIPTTYSFLTSMKGLTTQVLNIPRWLVFSCFLILFVDSFVRVIYRTYQDIVFFRTKQYTQNYPEREESKK